jgi:dUTP pyrophosphatase
MDKNTLIANPEFFKTEVVMNYTENVPLYLPDNRIKVVLDEGAKLPRKAHQTDAGYDLYSRQDYLIQSHQRRLISTGVHMAIPAGYVGLIWPRSGLSVKNGIDILAGVIDHGYTGEISVCLFNTSQEAFSVSAGDKIAQILIQAIYCVELVQVDTLDESTRGEKGFGSSGK